MRKNLHLVMLLLLAFVPFGLRAQNLAVVHGYVTDSVSREPVPYATVQLQNQEGTLINGAITNAGGRFTMKDVPFGEHVFTVSFVGYCTKRIVKEIKEKEQWVGVGIVVGNKQLQVKP